LPDFSVASASPGESLVAAPSAARGMPRRATEAERDDARRRELQKSWYRKAELVPLWLFQQG